MDIFIIAYTHTCTVQQADTPQDDVLCGRIRPRWVAIEIIGCMECEKKDFD